MVAGYARIVKRRTMWFRNTIGRLAGETIPLWQFFLLSGCLASSNLRNNGKIV